MTWVKDENGNKCSVEYFGTKEKAQAALDSLKNCRQCTNCSDCSDCSYCYRCSRCSDCSYCYRCSRCSDCSYCSRCSDCSDCSYCSRCSDCSDCSDCSYCSGCSRCSGRSDCYRCSGCSDKNEIKGTISVRPKTPKIENIHEKVFAAVSHPDALKMDNWHTCETTHCRGGWVVTLAGEEGKKLEEFFGPLLAAQLIYRESGYKINPCRFFDSNEDAMADMKRLAEAR